MWKRFAHQLRCPVSGEGLTLVSFKETDVLITNKIAADVEAAGYAKPGRDFYQRIEAGVLLAPAAGLLYPIARGVPLMHPYDTAAHAQFVREFSTELAKLRPRYRFPSCAPKPCERGFLRAFSRDWIGAHAHAAHVNGDDGEDERRLLTEVSLRSAESPQTLLEVGCGFGAATAQARQHLRGDAVGVDLGFSVVTASERFRHHPLLHFVQASAFCLPFDHGAFDVIYSRGVLRHTYAPREALLAIAKHCRPGGRFSLSVNLPAALGARPFLRVAEAADIALRPILSRAPGALGTAMLTPIALGSIGINRFRRRRNSSVPPATFDDALHTARDHFTPRFAHRQQPTEVVEWFREAGFEGIEVIDWSDLSTTESTYPRSTGVRADRPLARSRNASASH